MKSGDLSKKRFVIQPPDSQTLFRYLLNWCNSDSNSCCCIGITNIFDQQFCELQNSYFSQNLRTFPLETVVLFHI